MRHLLLAALIIFSTASCARYFRHDISVPGRNAANNAAGVNVGRLASGTASPEVDDLCDVKSLNERYASYERRVKNLGDDTVYDKKGRVTSNAPVAGVEIDREYQTSAVPRMISEFELELDAAYQATMTSCRSYARCMQNNFYDEGQCRSNLASWERARDDFADLARDLREIEAEVDRDRINRKGRYGRYGRHYLNSYEKCDCSQSTGGVFANCCDRDSDKRYERGRGY